MTSGHKIGDGNSWIHPDDPEGPEHSADADELMGNFYSIGGLNSHKIRLANKTGTWWFTPLSKRVLSPL